MCTKEALQLGYRMIDTAHMYGNEKEVGKAIRDSEVPRDQIFVVTKMDSRSNSYEKAKPKMGISTPLLSVMLFIVMNKKK